MQIIPTINCPDFNCVEERMKKAVQISADWAQIDIADGKFTAHTTWDNPNELKELRDKSQELRELNIEAHLMIENPLSQINKWIEAGAKRVIIHLEALNKSDSLVENLDSKNYGAEIGLAINPDTDVHDLEPYLAEVKYVLILAVPPGISGQQFDSRVLDKIKFLKQNYPDVIIEVDGGINLETAVNCKAVGADILSVGSCIWESENPKDNFLKLKNL